MLYADLHTAVPIPLLIALILGLSTIEMVLRMSQSIGKLYASTFGYILIDIMMLIEELCEDS